MQSAKFKPVKANIDIHLSGGDVTIPGYTVGAFQVHKQFKNLRDPSVGYSGWALGYKGYILFPFYTKKDAVLMANVLNSHYPQLGGLDTDSAQYEINLAMEGDVQAIRALASDIRLGTVGANAHLYPKFAA